MVPDKRKVSDEQAISVYNRHKSVWKGTNMSKEKKSDKGTSKRDARVAELVSEVRAEVRRQYEAEEATDEATDLENTAIYGCMDAGLAVLASVVEDGDAVADAVAGNVRFAKGLVALGNLARVLSFVNSL